MCFLTVRFNASASPTCSGLAASSTRPHVDLGFIRRRRRATNRDIAHHSFHPRGTWHWVNPACIRAPGSRRKDSARGDGLASTADGAGALHRSAAPPSPTGRRDGAGRRHQGPTPSASVERVRRPPGLRAQANGKVARRRPFCHDLFCKMQ